MFDLSDFNDPFACLILPSFMKLFFHFGREKWYLQKASWPAHQEANEAIQLKEPTLKETVKAATYKI